MSEIFSYIISSISISVITIYIWHCLLKKKLEISITKLLVIILLLVMAITCISYFFGSTLKITFSLIIMAIGNYFIFKENINKTIVLAFISQFILLVSEFIVLIIAVIIYGEEVTSISKMFTGQILFNFITSGVAFVVINISPIKKILRNIVELICRVKNYHIMWITSMLVITINVLIAIVYIKVSSQQLLIINTISIFIYTAICLTIIREKNENITYKAEKDALSGTLGDYRKMLDEQSMANHENKNQLSSIKGMITNKEFDKAVEYIDTTLKIKKEENASVLSKVKKIPSGSLQGILYQKILVIKDKKIKFKMDIDRNIKNIDFIKLDMKTNIDLCKIVGIFLDNAIEEVEKFDEKEIMFDLYLDGDDMAIKVSNNYRNIDIEKMSKIGYTTKGKGHGYGLSLVEEILKKNKNLVNEKEIHGKLFLQTIKVLDLKED